MTFPEIGFVVFFYVFMSKSKSCLYSCKIIVLKKNILMAADVDHCSSSVKKCWIKVSTTGRGHRMIHSKLFCHPRNVIFCTREPYACESLPLFSRAIPDSWLMALAFGPWRILFHYWQWLWLYDALQNCKLDPGRWLTWNFCICRQLPNSLFNHWYRDVLSFYIAHYL